MTSSSQMLERIDRTWNDWLAAIDGLSDEQISQPGAAGEWSVKDLMNHIAFWDDQARQASMKKANGEEPPPHNWQKMNDADAAENRDRSPDDSRKRMFDAHSDLVAGLSALNHFEESWVDDDTWGHYPEHASDVRAWREETQN